MNLIALHEVIRAPFRDENHPLDCLPAANPISEPTAADHRAVRARERQLQRVGDDKR